MAAPVALRDLVGALDLPEEWSAWLDRETGAVIELDPETRAAAVADEEDDADQEALADGFPSEALATAARAIAAGDPRYVELPDAFDFHEYRHMERFAAGIEDAGVAEEVGDALRGRGAFRYFRDTIRRHGLLEAWFAHRERAAEQHMLDWAEANGVTVTRGPK